MPCFRGNSRCRGRAPGFRGNSPSTDVQRLITTTGWERFAARREEIEVDGSTSTRSAQVYLLLSSPRYEWGFGLMRFGVHLILLGYLEARGPS